MSVNKDLHPDRPAECNNLPGQVVLVFQGGGALGSYQAGVYQALHEADIEPDWIIGTSIGAINASLIAGNRRDDRIPKLWEFWRRVESHPGWNFSGFRRSFELVDLGRRYSRILQTKPSGALGNGSSRGFGPGRILFDHASSKDALRTRRFRADQS